MLSSVHGRNRESNLDLIDSLTVIHWEVYMTYVVVAIIIAYFASWLTKLVPYTFLWNIFRDTLNQGIDESLMQKSNPQFNRFIFISFMISSLYITSVFINLMSTDLVSVKPVILINTLVDFIESDKFPIFAGGYYGYEIFESSQNPLFRTIWNKRNKNRYLTTEKFDDNMMAIKTDYAYFHTEEILEFYEKANCRNRLNGASGESVENDFHMSKDSYANSLYSMLLRRPNNKTTKIERARLQELRNRLDFVALTMSEFGLVQYWLTDRYSKSMERFYGGGDDWLSRTAKCVSNKSYTSQSNKVIYSIRLRNIIKMLIVISYCHAFAICVVYLENMIRLFLVYKKWKIAKFRKMRIAPLRQNYM